MSGISELNPFVGPRPIQQGEPLYGRKAEVRELYHQLQARRIVVLHSPSGAGKSSLVQAGLIPRLREDAFDVWKPIRVNLDPASFEGVPEGTNRYLLSALVSLEDELPAEHRRSPAALAKLGFREYLSTRPRRKSRAKDSVVLLFDQFEEVVSVGPRDIEAKVEFFTVVGEALDAKEYWALFIIREDFLATLAPYRDLIPTQLLNTFRLDLLGLEGARDAALKLSEQGGRNFVAVDRLVRDLSAVQVQQADGTVVVEQGLHVEPVHLQVVCRRLWDAMPAEDLSIFEEDIEAYAGVSKSLAAYYADAVRSIAGEDVALERTIRDWVGTKLITGGIRSQIRQEVGKSAGLDNHHVEKLLDSYLVRTEQRADANWFELGHDRLVEPILEDNELWQQAHLHPLQVQAKLWEDAGRARALLLGDTALPNALSWAQTNTILLTKSEEEFLQLSEALHAERERSLRRRRLFTVVLAIVALVAFGFGGIAWKMRGAAETKRVEAELAQSDAEQARTKAVVAQGDAEQARSKAVQAQKKNERLTRELLRQMFQVALRRFLESLDQVGVDSGELAIDEHWTPLLERGGQVFAAANVVEGGGRLVAAGSDAVLSEVDEHGDSLFLEITVRWLLRDQAKRGVAIVTQQPSNYERLEILRRNLSALGYDYALDPPLVSLADDESTGILIIDNRQWSEFRPEEVDAVEALVRRGGGLLAVGSGQSWLAREPSEGQSAPTLDNYPMNQIMGRFGIHWSEASIDPKTLEAAEEEASVRFENTSGEAVSLFTLNYERREEYYTTLEDNEVLDLRTVVGREWVVRSLADARSIGEAKVSTSRQIVSITGTVSSKSALRPKPRPRPEPEPEAEPEAEPELLPKTLSNSAMKSALVAAEQASRACGREYASLATSLKVEFDVGPSGEVTKAVALPPMGGTPPGTCVAKKVSALRFARSREGVSKTWTLPL